MMLIKFFSLSVLSCYFTWFSY